MPEASAISPGAYVHPDAVIGAGVRLAPGVVVEAGAQIGARAEVGAGSIVHTGVRIGAGCVVEDLVVLGKRPRLRPGSSAAAVPLADLVLGEGVTVCCGAVLYAGASVGAHAIIGDQAQVREGSTVGARSVVGRGACVDFKARVGERVSLQTGVYVTSYALVEDDAFLGPGALMTNDNTMGRHVHGEPLPAPIVRRAARVGGGVVLVPGVEVGEEAFIAAGAVVTRNVPPRTVVLGIPARPHRPVADSELLERWR